MKELTIVRQNGGAYIDSREVAELIGKRHDNLRRDIGGYLKTLGKIDALNFEGVDFFRESTYVDIKGEVRPNYLLSKMGCEFVANKLTGEKGVLFTAAYVAKYNEMEAAERLAEAAQYHPKLGDFTKAARLIVTAYGNAGANAGQIVKFLENVYEPLGIKVLDDGLSDSALPAYTYSPYQIAKTLGAYSWNCKPHYQAVAAVARQLDIAPEHIVAAPVRYGDYYGVHLRYDIDASAAIMRWFVENYFPEEIESGDRVFHVMYVDED